MFDGSAIDNLVQLMAKLVQAIENDDPPPA
jgi:hypothetical protein